MSEDLMLYCLIAFILGWLISRNMGNGFSVGGQTTGGTATCNPLPSFLGGNRYNFDSCCCLKKIHHGADCNFHCID